jgi:hypothetical protein
MGNTRRPVEQPLEEITKCSMFQSRVASGPWDEAMLGSKIYQVSIVFWWLLEIDYHRSCE